MTDNIYQLPPEPVKSTVQIVGGPHEGERWSNSVSYQWTNAEKHGGLSWPDLLSYATPGAVQVIDSVSISTVLNLDSTIAYQRREAAKGQAQLDTAGDLVRTIHRALSDYYVAAGLARPFKDQVTRSELDRMTSAEIDEARTAGRLRNLMGVVPMPSAGP